MAEGKRFATPSRRALVLGPYTEGTYSFLLEDGTAIFPMPRRAGFSMQGRPPLLRLRVKYESPEGWVAYSPEMQVRLAPSG